MKKPNLHRLSALAACLLCGTYFTIPAYAQSSEPQAETTSAETIPVETVTPEEPAEPNPFTPDGTGTVVDKATDKDGKEFYTITTPDENIFFLVIDNQKSSENVYFLNAVTETDLLPLAEKDGEGTAVEPETTPAPKTEPETETPTEEPEQPEPAPKEDKADNGLFSLLLAAAVVMAGGGAGYYFKIYKPKHQAPDLEDDYCEYEEEAEEPEESEEDDTPPWNEEEPEAGGEDKEDRK